jgi:hypothetical protein
VLCSAMDGSLSQEAEPPANFRSDPATTGGAGGSDHQPSR